MRVDDMHSIAVPAQVELVDHPVVEETDEIRARAHHESRILEGMLERARAADAVARFEHEHGATGTGEIGGRGEAVVAGADNDRVPWGGARLAGHRHARRNVIA